MISDMEFELFINSLNAQLVSLYSDGSYAEVIEKGGAVLRKAEQHLGHDHPAISDTLNNIAEAHRALGQFKLAEQLCKRALAITETKFGSDHISNGTSLNNLAELYRAQGMYELAEPLYKRDIAITEKAAGRNHIDLAPSCQSDRNTDPGPNCNIDPICACTSRRLRPEL